MLQRTPVFLLVILLLVGCEQQELPKPFSSFEEIDSPTDADARFPYLHEQGDSLLVGWQSVIDDETTRLYLGSLNDGSFSNSEQVTEGRDWFVNWADFPVIGSSENGSIMMSFMTSSGPGTFEYDLNFISKMDGRWNDSLIPHEDGTLTEHGFASMEPYMEDKVITIWLDGRQMESSDDDERSDHDSHGNGDMMLMHAMVDPSDGVQKKAPLDRRVCECCPTASTQTSEAAQFFYRDRADDETRNISVVAYNFDRHEWSEPQYLFDDGWQVHGCPVNGPAADSYEDVIGTAWFTSPSDNPKTRVAFSDDHGNSFTAPVEIHIGNALGRVDLRMINRQTAVVSWIEQQDDETLLKARLINKNGEKGTPQKLASGSYLADRASGFPRMARVGSNIYLGWTKPGSSYQIKLLKGSVTPEI